MNCMLCEYISVKFLLKIYNRGDLTQIFKQCEQIESAVQKLVKQQLYHVVNELLLTHASGQSDKRIK